MALAALAAPASLQTKDVVAVAMGNKNFTTLVKLVKSAGLVSTLQGKGPFTILAPTNAAFAKVPASLLAKLGKDKALLRKVLTYHVIPGRILAKDLKSMSAKT
ncbi:fasciclin domain-containing protein, partial [bacterium]